MSRTLLPVLKEFLAGDMREWIRRAYALAADSPDPSTQNGALLVELNMLPAGSRRVITGRNSFPRKVTVTAERLDRPAKYLFLEHAERAALFAAACNGVVLNGSVLVCPFAACADCARAVVGMGVGAVVRHRADMHRRLSDRWGLSIAAGDQILKEAGVHVEEVTGRFDGCEILFGGERVVPQ